MRKTIYSEEYKYLVQQLRKARESAKLKQEDVAKLLDLDQSFISRLERGQYRIDVIQLQQFAKLYKKTLNYFIK
ncbi:MAG: helix-turn-helix transcriptional regulator [Phycisphaerales bacterium]